MPRYRFRPLVSPYPLTLITPASDQRITSTFGGLAVSDATPVLEMNPEDAATRGYGRQWVKVFNELGEVFLRLRVTTPCAPAW